MQYVRSTIGSVSKTWNSINPATLSGAIDVVVVEQEDGSLACSPFHIRFGKFSLLRPSDKKVEFKINGEKLEFPMKLGEGGEAFFVFETRDRVPEALQTSPLVSPAASPGLSPSPQAPPSLQEPDPFDLESLQTGLDEAAHTARHTRSATEAFALPEAAHDTRSDLGRLGPFSSTHDDPRQRSMSTSLTFEQSFLPKLERVPSDSVVPAAKVAIDQSLGQSELLSSSSLSDKALSAGGDTARPSSPPAQDPEEARARAMTLSKKLWISNISNQVTESGDLMLDMTGFKSGNMEALHAEGIARQLLSEEMDGPYDIGALIGADEKGNIWIYSSEEAKEAAGRRAAAQQLGAYNPSGFASVDALSDPGYHSDDTRSDPGKTDFSSSHLRRDSDSAVGLTSQPGSPGVPTAAGDPNKNYAKTLRLTSDQLKTVPLKNGANNMAFTVNRATCNATLWYWKYNVPIVISDIDGTITKSDVLGHVLNSIGRDWTHSGVAKLYTEIASNGYNFLYLTSRSVGQADTTRAYLDGVQQDGFKLPKGPVILSPDRTIAALRREIYLRKPEIFKMACLRDIMALFIGHGGANNTLESQEAGLKPIPAIDNPPESAHDKGKFVSPFYAGFGNRLTDALSYRSVNIPSTRIFTINSNSEVSLDLLSLNTYKTAYSTMREIVDHYFPPVGLLVQGGGEEFTDFNYWRERPMDVDFFTDSEDDDSDDDDDDEPGVPFGRVRTKDTAGSILSEDEAGDDMQNSLIADVQHEYETAAEETEDSAVEDEEDEDDEDDDHDSVGPTSKSPARTPQLTTNEIRLANATRYLGSDIAFSPLD